MNQGSFTQILSHVKRRTYESRWQSLAQPSQNRPCGHVILPLEVARAS